MDKSIKHPLLWSMCSILLGAIPVFANDTARHQTRKATDDGFVLLEQKVSLDQRHVALSYQYDNGALGYSRVWWAVVPREFKELNLVHFEIPDGYKIAGWEEDSGDLLLVKWKPYYFTKKDVNLSTGEHLYGVRIRIVHPSGLP